MFDDPSHRHHHETMQTLPLYQAIYLGWLIATSWRNLLPGASTTGSRLSGPHSLLTFVTPLHVLDAPITSSKGVATVQQKVLIVGASTSLNVITRIWNAIYIRELSREVKELRTRAGDKGGFWEFWGSSAGSLSELETESSECRRS